jgi:PleD family two-component response regulator
VETILVVDDEPEVLAVAVDMLEGKGYKTLQTSDPLTALRIARTESEPIHLLLTDVVMPLMNGREFPTREEVTPAVEARLCHDATVWSGRRFIVNLSPSQTATLVLTSASQGVPPLAGE